MVSNSFQGLSLTIGACVDPHLSILYSLWVKFTLQRSVSRPGYSVTLLIKGLEEGGKQHKGQVKE